MSIIIKHPSGLRFEIGDDGSTAFGTVNNPRACLTDGELKMQQGSFSYFGVRLYAHAFYGSIFKVLNCFGLKFVQPFRVFTPKSLAQQEKRIGKGLSQG